MYKLIKGIISEEISCIRRESDNSLIPFDESNTDYKQYLAWVAEGNTAEEINVEEV
jgi:hypothetical protein